MFESSAAGLTSPGLNPHAFAPTRLERLFSPSNIRRTSNCAISSSPDANLESVVTSSNLARLKLLTAEFVAAFPAIAWTPPGASSGARQARTSRRKASRAFKAEFFFTSPSLSEASVARLSSLDASFLLSTPASTRDLPTFWTFFAASAETDLPAAFSSRTSSSRTTLLASAIFGGRASHGTTSASGRSGFVFSVFCASS